MKRVVFLIAALGLVACSNDDGAKNAATQTTTTSTLAATTSTTDPGGAFGAAAVKTPDSSPPALLTDVKVGDHGTFARVVFQFGIDDVTAPGHDIGPASPPFLQEASGATVAVAGTGFITARMSASGHNDAGHQTYVGPTRIPGVGPITEVVALGDFEGVMRWTIGTAGTHRFRVFPLTNPTRLVVDVETATA